ncbi:MAG TPA: S49 family peptidase [Alphaproteobacteria bacterium]|nr:S49 family peptidase [Alphaproteobacteria bacterium]
MFFGSRGPVVAVIRLHGVIGRMGPLRSGLTLAGLAAVIERAFKMKHLKAVAISVNSPGGSPVQSSLIFKRLRALAEEKDIPILAFAEDAAASGGYWLACAGDEIFADENSIVGSIGVISGGFGFPELLRRIGVERRMHTAGNNKGMLDPFQPEKPEDVKHLKSLQSDIHESFIDLVRSRRGKRLKGDDKEVFSGAFWTGRRALELGLVDGIGDLRSVIRDRFGEKARLRLVQARRGYLSRRLGFRAGGDGLPGPAGWAAELLAAVEERFLWNRLGL